MRILIVFGLCIGSATAWRLNYWAKALGCATILTITQQPPSVFAVGAGGDKLVNLPEAKFLEIVAADLSERQALATADFTRAVYSEACTFQDEIDTYKLAEYVEGTKKLFDGHKSHVELASPPTFVDPAHRQVEYRFRETLVFNVPFNPRVDLTGKVLLTRGDDGLVVSSREFWDDKVTDVLKKIYF